MKVRSAVGVAAAVWAVSIGAAAHGQIVSKPLLLRCTLMRRDGSQFATAMRVLYNSGLTKSNSGVSIEMNGAAPDLPRGTYKGVVSGIPLMEREVFELGAEGGTPTRRKEFVLDTDLSFASDGRPTGLGYLAAISRTIEDLRTTVAVGYCRPA